MALTIFGSRRTASLAAQFNASSDSSTSDSFDGLPIATWRGRRFNQDELLWKKGSRAPKTWIKDHGDFMREIKRGDASGIGPDHHYLMQRADHGSAERLWVCSIYDERPISKTGTEYPPPDGPLTSSGCEDARPRKRPRTSPIPKTQSTKVQELACGFIVNTDQTFGVFDDRYLRELLHSQRRQLEVVFDSKKCFVQQSLREAIKKIHVAFDLWTSPNRYAIVAVSGHFLDKEGRQQQRLLALTRQPGPHAGGNIAHTLRRVVEDWQIEDMIGTLVSDNATNNDTCADHFFRAIGSALTHGDRVERRMRCYGHILNLVGRAFLYGEDGKTFEQENQRLLDADLIEDDLRHWRHRGPVGRLRNTIKPIRASPQRSERFQTLASEADDQDAWLIHQESSRELQLILSNETRWNSTYQMIERALRKHGHLQTFLIENQMEEDASKRLPAEDVLHPEDWRLLVELKEILAPLYFQTMRCQGWGQRGSHGYVWEIMTGM
ncbi:transposase [Purpureocillium lilacinum]|uniref:Transposase n=1 Tax=Purpureocillium lilacinum TaxID=33203 RepID=A0A179F7B5_PURLI|nr:transposase [Purpureocillium lilacinum]